MLFLIKLYARNDIFKFIKRSHGQNFTTVIPSLEQKQTKYMKLNTDIKFIKSCKKENIIPTFAKVNFSIKSGSYKLKRKIRLVMNTGLQNKHIQKRKLKNEIRKKCTELKRTCFHEINLALKSKLKKIIKSHQTKLINLRRQQNKNTFGVATTHIKHYPQFFIVSIAK